jgi:hypothetical protein
VDSDRNAEGQAEKGDSYTEGKTATPGVRWIHHGWVIVLFTVEASPTAGGVSDAISLVARTDYGETRKDGGGVEFVLGND